MKEHFVHGLFTYAFVVYIFSTSIAANKKIWYDRAIDDTYDMKKKSFI